MLSLVYLMLVWEIFHRLLMIFVENIVLIITFVTIIHVHALFPLLFLLVINYDGFKAFMNHQLFAGMLTEKVNDI